MSGDAIIAAKEVEHPERYGVLELNSDDKVIRVTEKPKDPPSNKVITGIYLIRNIPKFLVSLQKIINGLKPMHGEYQLTDVLQDMINSGGTLRAFYTGEWFDCGQKESILLANKTLLGSNTQLESKPENTVIIPPVAIGKKCQIIKSVIGPNVSIASESIITHSIISNSVIGAHTKITGISLFKAMIGDDVELEGTRHELSVGDGSFLRFGTSSTNIEE